MPAIAKRVNDIDAGVIARSINARDRMDRHFVCSISGIFDILREKITASMIPNKLEFFLIIIVSSVRAGVDMAIAALRL